MPAKLDTILKYNKLIHIHTYSWNTSVYNTHAGMVYEN